VRIARDCSNRARCILTEILKDSQTQDSQRRKVGGPLSSGSYMTWIDWPCTCATHLLVEGFTTQEKKGRKEGNNLDPLGAWNWPGRLGLGW